MLFWIWGALETGALSRCLVLQRLIKKQESGANAVIFPYPGCLTSNIQFPFDR